MRKFEGIKIFFIALITGSIMGIVLIQIFHNLTIKNVITLEIILILVIIMLFVTTTLWNRRQNQNKNKNIL
jgi:uncharacterized membrane protein YdjX (TVP38/TMEM64 family)